MNWHRIAEMYPLTYAEFNEWATDDACSHWCDRDLYDFFDEKEIIVIIKKVRGELSFSYYIITDMGVEYAMNLFESRCEAEQRAFEKAFEIYENKRKSIA